MDAKLTPEERLAGALRAADPRSSVWALAKTLRDEGTPQLDLYFLYQEAYSLNEEEPLEDALLDTLDGVFGGPWAKGSDLYPHELTNEMVDQARRVRKEQKAP